MPIGSLGIGVDGSATGAGSMLIGLSAVRTVNSFEGITGSVESIEFLVLFASSRESSSGLARSFLTITYKPKAAATAAIATPIPIPTVTDAFVAVEFELPNPAPVEGKFEEPPDGRPPPAPERKSPNPGNNESSSPPGVWVAKPAPEDVEVDVGDLEVALLVTVGSGEDVADIEKVVGMVVGETGEVLAGSAAGRVAGIAGADSC